VIAGRPKAEAEARARTLLVDWGLAERLTHQSARLSAGAAARRGRRGAGNRRGCCCATSRPANSTPVTSKSVFQGLHDLARQSGVAALVATHNLELTSFMTGFWR